MKSFSISAIKQYLFNTTIIKLYILVAFKKLTLQKYIIIKMSNFQLKSYQFDKKKHIGIAHIFSNNNYGNGDVREGNDIDVTALKETLPKLGFIVNKPYENLTRYECFCKLDNIAKNDGNEHTVLLVIFLSHGNLNNVKLSDHNEITIKQIVQDFNKKRSSFIGQPKIFLFQVCQGNKSAEPLSKESTEQLQRETEKHSAKKEEEDTLGTFENEGNHKDALYNENSYGEVEDTDSVVPRNSDMFMGFASSPGFVAYRHPDHGSRFIQTFTTIINDEINSPTTEKLDFISLMTKVAAEVAIMSGGHWPELLKNKAAGGSVNEQILRNGKFQMPWYSSTLTKKLEFKAISQNSQPEHDVEIDEDSAK